ncbi:tRNA (adenosine(37)-N6)-dimethylallyltransferase MiaA [Cellulophaga sp. HaHaR_3_176]|uniref:tRNA (adenosine(37)-N6)-dimethylallyltransferase MiaA n=1 Tax=Cellulophaga sp. HaHaR_3_176 TaxID=1942464 RepID=UPI001C1F9A9D|nr:tRNA (adenosine(37)-N6)-dimethylallyltransferase MiaA [Cellulophaga sp. HaHaR_3_176]QWX82538.1 tRNA (adenosine(37)-N6)-dimethylallyltransferase MiaA [Cellulophaga sp. HaHaR_3_176]
MKKTLITVIGPTAIGKTRLAIELAKHYKAEIISADSRQFFKEMKIGTAVPSNEELAAATHHFIQHKSIQEHYTVGDFEREAMTLTETLFHNNNIAILVGGSGLYIDAVTKGLDYFPDVDPEIRVQLNQKIEEEGLENLQTQLKELDPIYFDKVDIHNPHRVIRALEICIGSGKPYSSFLNKDKNKRPFQVISVGIEADREVIYDRINRRVDIMIEDGLLEEAKSLEKYKELNALQTVGYRELFNYFNGECTLEFAISEIKKNTRRFAKRQLTWFKKTENVIWVPFNADIDAVVQQIELIKDE